MLCSGFRHGQLQERHMAAPAMQFLNTSVVARSGCRLEACALAIVAKNGEHALGSLQLDRISSS